MRRARGLTLVELMVGLLMVFAAASTLCLVLASAADYLAKARVRSQALQAAASQSQLLTIAQGWDHFLPSGTRSGTTATVGSGDVLVDQFMQKDGQYSGDDFGLFQLTTVINFGPTGGGQTMKLETLSLSWTLQDVTTGANEWVLFLGPPYNNIVNLYNSVTGSQVLLPALPLVPYPAATGTPYAYPTPLPLQPVVSGLAADDKFDLLVASDANLGAFQVQPGPAALSSWIPYTQNQIVPAGTSQGVASSAAGDQLWFVVTDHRCVCSRSATGWTTWYPDPAQAGSDATPLVLPVNIAFDEANQRIWVADQGNLCLRGMDMVGPHGTWGPPLGPFGMGRPRGVACTSTDVYTADGLNFYDYNIKGRTWSVTALPAELQAKIEAMHYNSGTNVLWINTNVTDNVKQITGWLYRCDPTIPSFTAEVPTLVPSPTP